MPRRAIRSTKLPTEGVRGVTADASRCTLRPDIHDRLLQWADENYSAGAIIDGLRKEFGSAPHRNTVYKEMRRHAPPGEAWSLADEEFSEAQVQLVLTELASVYELSKGQRRHFTKREAWWIARLKTIHNSGAADFVPLEPGEAFRMARLHVYAESRGEQLAAWLDVVTPGEAQLHAYTRSRHLFAPKEASK